MSRKIDRMFENDLNKSYQPNISIDQIMVGLQKEDIKVAYKPRFAWGKHLAKAFLVLIVIAFVFVGCLSVKHYTTERKEFATSIWGITTIGKKRFEGLSKEDLAQLQRAYNSFYEIPILVIYHFDDIRIYVYNAENETAKKVTRYYICLVEYAKNNTDETSILIDGKEVFKTQETSYQVIASRTLESFDSDSQLEFVVDYRGESRKVVTKKK